MKLKTPNNFPIVMARLAKGDEKVLAGAEKGLRSGLDFTRTMVMREFLSGPRSKTKLDAISGRLRGSISYAVQRSGKGIVGRIGSNMKYARFHEFGFSGEQSVKAHTRHLNDANWDGGGRGRKDVFERPIREATFVNAKGRRQAGKIISRGAKIGTRLESVKEAEKRGVSFVRQQVGAHSRRINYAGRPFIKPALVKAQSKIKDMIMEEINLATGSTPT